MGVQNIQIKTKKISELDSLKNNEKLINSNILISYTENGSKENYKVKVKDLIDNAISKKGEEEYSVNIFTNGAILLSQSPGPYLKNSIVSLKFKALDNYQLTNNSYFITNCELINWNKEEGQIDIKITGAYNPIVNITADPLNTYIINYSGLKNMNVNISKMSFVKNENIDIQLTPYYGYTLPENINSFALSGGTLISYNNTTGNLRINVIENMILSGEAIEKQKYNVNIDIENSSYDIIPNNISFYENDVFILKINPNKGYNVPSQLNVTNGTIISYNDGIAKIKVNGNDNIYVSGTLQFKEIEISLIMYNLTYNKIPNYLTYHINDIIKLVITPNNGYILPKASDILLNGCNIISYENNEIFIKIIDDHDVKVIINPELNKLNGLNFALQDASQLTNDLSDSQIKFGDQQFNNINQHVELSLNVDLLQKIKASTIDTTTNNLIGSMNDSITSLTIYGARNYAKNLVDELSTDILNLNTDHLALINQIKNEILFPDGVTGIINTFLDKLLTVGAGFNGIDGGTEGASGTIKNYIDTNIEDLSAAISAVQSEADNSIKSINGLTGDENGAVTVGATNILMTDYIAATGAVTSTDSVLTAIAKVEQHAIDAVNAAATAQATADNAMELLTWILI